MVSADIRKISDIADTDIRYQYKSMGHKYRNNSVSEFRYRKYRPIPDTCGIGMLNTTDDFYKQKHGNRGSLTGGDGFTTDQKWCLPHCHAHDSTANTCFVQIYFFVVCNSAESLVFLALGLDRYIAICHPLSYHRILNKKICLLISAIMWIFAFLNSLIILNSLVTLPFYGVVIIHSFFCDATDVFNTSHGVSQEFQIIIAIELVFLGLSPVFFNFLSYGKIIRVILHIKSKDGRKKAFSTCLSHLITMSMYYSAGFVEYLVSNQNPTGILKQMLSVIYVILVPMINPLIYSLRSSEILRACRKLLKIKEPSVTYYSNKVEN
ncbi:unnamed protein product [Ranitomeya imitator]|uniref:G-protein coupled receptors family 1 profile domain-containing protein n=1 Tax=Ranitomeya imitator TaxID=111125 RepID=A0ABN9LKS5_9NEOB|nr:unnamed protein product [Ranitomeya imitator]